MRKPLRLLPALLAASALFGAALPAISQTQTTQAPAASAPAAAGPQVDYASFNSPALGRELKFAVLLPDSYEKETKRKYPVLYFLHGMNGNEGEFQKRGVAAAVAKLQEQGKLGELIIIAPAGQNSFYLNAKNGARYEDAIIQDLIPHVEKTYRTVGNASGRAIQGLSMGGFGALLLAFKHPEMFSSVSAHSSALFAELPNTTGNDRRSQFMAQLVGRIFGDPPDDAFFRANNPFFLGETNAAAIKKSGIKIYFDVGEQDRYGFQGANKSFDESLTKAGIAHEYHMFPGGHGWEYMISVADKSYEFLWKSFKAGVKDQPAGRPRASR
jgi:S-formylglutathione hydrolase FrmB